MTGIWRGSSLSFEVPRVSLAFTTKIARRTEEHAGRITTVLVEPDERGLSIVWQSLLRVHALEADYLDSTEINEQPG